MTTMLHGMSEPSEDLCGIAHAACSEENSRPFCETEFTLDTLNISVKHVASRDKQLCGVCTAPFVPAEDSGSRVLSMTGLNQDGFAGLLCGGCYSKWSHGTAVALRRA
jgi:hypothetical protein